MPEAVVECALVRHGESTGNLGERVLGHEMTPALTALGHTQARAAASILAGWGGEALWSSDMVRARQTAAEIAVSCGLPVVTTSRLREQDHGRLDGLSRGQLATEPTPPGLDISEVGWGGGESVADVYRRLRAFCGLLAARPARRVIVVSHGDVLCAMASMLCGRGHRHVDWDARLSHGEVRFLRWRLGQTLPL
ncbi:probable phosphoglycerate mutase [Propionibacterium cyclohexanicum]|uniref:Probable phosphoglycerate mutase n=1 Tax=Propionibacterium cyclohexanicum TaxID=64702 RepID=A0A1H9TZW6_9ACTN|nr:histidine phosphatase family protein [Propionibacterium cyclohexanicum]SES02726.1 probable phosphoglycerate mutase [Propionibacterium cyclohexanicum]